MDQIVLLSEPLKLAFPQRLKPQPILRFYGTAKAVPFQSNKFFRS
jgi:hypothetical protein